MVQKIKRNHITGLLTGNQLKIIPETEKISRAESNKRRRRSQYRILEIKRSVINNTQNNARNNEETAICIIEINVLPEVNNVGTS